MTNSDTPPIFSSLYNVQPTSHTSNPRNIPSLPYTTENLKFINNINFQFYDLTDTKYITLCNLLLKYKTCCATHKNDFDKVANPFRIRLSPMLNLLHNVLLKYQFITETNSILFLKNFKNTTL